MVFLKMKICIIPVPKKSPKDSFGSLAEDPPPQQGLHRAEIPSFVRKVKGVVIGLKNGWLWGMPEYV